MSFSSTSIPEEAVNALMTGKKEYVASAGASSVWVYTILGLFSGVAIDAPF
jgi:hypothetical protein